MADLGFSFAMPGRSTIASAGVKIHVFILAVVVSLFRILMDSFARTRPHPPLNQRPHYSSEI